MINKHNPLNGYISHTLAAVHRDINASLARRLKTYGVQLEAWRVMETLYEMPGITMSELATNVLMNPPTLTKLVDRMVSDNLVHRQIDRRDHRKVNLVLTDLGLKRMTQIRKEVELEDERIVNLLGKDDFAQLNTILSKITANS